MSEKQISEKIERLFSKILIIEQTCLTNSSLLFKILQSVSSNFAEFVKNFEKQKDEKT